MWQQHAAFRLDDYSTPELNIVGLISIRTGL